jgi:hypothetical protein
VQGLAVGLVALILAGAAAARLFTVADRVVCARLGAALAVALVAVVASGLIGFGARGESSRQPETAARGGHPPRAGLVVKDFTRTDRDNVTRIVLTITVWES